MAEDIREGSTEPTSHSWRSKLNWTVAVEAVLSCVLAVELVELVFYNLVTYRLLFHSDSAVKNLLAEEIIRAHDLLPSEWVFVNDLWVLANHLYVLILSPFFKGSSFLLHGAAGILNLIALGAVTWLFLIKLGLRRVTRLLTMTILMSGISYYVSENLFGQAAYGFIVTVTLLELLLFFLALEHSSKRGAFAGYSLLFGALLCLAVLGGIRWVLTLSIPLLLSNLSYLLFFRVDTGRSKALLWLTLVIVIGTGLGLALGAKLNSTHTVLATSQSSGFADTDRIMSNAKWLVLGLLFLFGALPSAGTALVSIGGVIFIYSAAFLCLVLGVAIVWVRNLRNIEHLPLLYFTIFTVIGTLLNLYFVLFTNIMIDIGSARYLVLSAISVLILAVSCLDSMWHTWFRSGRAALAVAAMLVPLYLISANHLVLPVIKISDTQNGPLRISLNRTQNDNLAAFLTSQQQSYCYATYWRASATTVLSDSVVKVRAILLVDGLPIPYKHLASLSWYKPETHPGSTCLILTKDEEEVVAPDKLLSFLGPPVSVLQFENLDIFVYPFNIAAKLPNWP
jgi:hypothetical protein